MLKIPVCYSFDTPVIPEFQNDMYVPIGCGGYTSPDMRFSDSDGDNISGHNVYLNEMTMIYWMARNYCKLGDPDYVGTAHYRRYLDFDQNDLVPKTVICSMETQPYSIYQTYCMYHVKSDLDMFIAAFVNMFPFYEQALHEYLSQRTHAKCNMFVMPKDPFFDYFQFIKPCIDICIDGMIPLLDLSKRDRYQRRAPAFILERMTGFWVYFASKEGRIFVKNVAVVEKNVDSIYSRQ